MRRNRLESSLSEFSDLVGSLSAKKAQRVLQGISGVLQGKSATRALPINQQPSLINRFRARKPIPTDLTAPGFLSANLKGCAI